MARVHYLQHVPFEGLGSIEPWLVRRGHTITATHLYAGDVLPAPNDVDWLIVMGGPMGIYDYGEHPWLTAEKQFIRSCIDSNKIALGICLGAQLIADVLGGPVSKNPQREIGWFPLKVTDAGKQNAFGQILINAGDVFHWHGDTFSIPAGAVHLASSAACQHQAFVYDGKVLGLQFHLETTPESAGALCNECAEELTPDQYVQSAHQMLASAENFERINSVMEDLLALLEKKLEF